MLNNNTFICINCKQFKQITQLAGTVNFGLDKLVQEKELKEKDLAQITLSEFANHPTTKPLIEKLQAEIQILHNQIKNNKQSICKNCFNFTPTTNLNTFTCAICHEEKQGAGLYRHIDNYQDQGINPLQIQRVCRLCLQTKVIIWNGYCPRTSSGRDDFSGNKFDCFCPPKSKK